MTIPLLDIIISLLDGCTCKEQVLGIMVWSSGSPTFLESNASVQCEM